MDNEIESKEVQSEILNLLKDISNSINDFTRKKEVMLSGEQYVTVASGNSYTVGLNGKYWYNLDIRVEFASTPSSNAYAIVDLSSKELQQPLTLNFDATVVRTKLDGVKVNNIVLKNSSGVSAVYVIGYIATDYPINPDIELRSS